MEHTPATFFAGDAPADVALREATAALRESGLLLSPVIIARAQVEAETAWLRATAGRRAQASRAAAERVLGSLAGSERVQEAAARLGGVPAETATAKSVVRWKACMEALVERVTARAIAEQVRLAAEPASAAA